MDARVRHQRHYQTLQVNHHSEICYVKHIYNNADFPLTAPLLNMIIKRDWTRKDGNIHMPYLLHAMEGFSPFTMLDLSEDGVVLLNNENYLITSASLISKANIRKQRKHQKVCVPTEADEFMLMLQC